MADMNNAMQEYKSQIIASMNWDYRKTNRGRRAGNDADITIALTNSNTDGIKRKHISITFRNDVEQLITSDGDRIVTAISKNRVYFKADERGYKLSRHKRDSSNKTIQTKILFQEEYLNFIGDYSLKYDDFLEMYYVEKENRTT